MSVDCDVLVVGAGVSGLTAAFRLAVQGIRIEIIDAAARAGGVIESVQSDGALYERGPNSILDTSPHINELLDQLGIRAARIDASAVSAQRFVVCAGRLVALPRSLPAFLGTPLFSTRAKFALLREPFISRAPAGSEESVAQFVTRRLGREFLDYAIEPFVAGIYAGDPAQLSLPAAFPRLHALEQRYGSLVKGQICRVWEKDRRPEQPKSVAKSFSFVRGLQTLIDALTARASVHTATRAASLRREAGAIVVTVERAGAATTEIRTRAVVLAVPADRAAMLVRDVAPAAARALAGIPYAPVASVASVYRRADVAHALDGFGFLAPRVEQRRILGTLFSSTMFAGRVGKDQVLLTTFVGGQREPALPALPEADLVRIVSAELAALLGARGTPLSCAVTRWPGAIPQYTLGHLQRIGAAATAESALPGLFLCASYRGGVAVGDCIASGCRTADMVTHHLELDRSTP